MNFLKRIVSSFIVAATAFTSVGGGLSVSPLKTFAIDEDSILDETEEMKLSAGNYIVPLLRNTSDELDLSLKYVRVYNRFLDSALLTINNDGTQSLTIGIEHWSMYDEFAVLNQSKTDEYNRLGYSIDTFPDGFFMTKNPLTYVCNTAISTKVLRDENGNAIKDENGKKIKVTTYTYDYLNGNEQAKNAYLDAGYTIAENCDDFFNFNPETDYETGRNFDIAYVTIPIDNYADRIYTYSWFNSCDSAQTTLDKLFDSSIIYLDLNNIESWDNIENNLNDGKVCYSVGGVSSSNLISNGIQNFGNEQTHYEIEGVFNKKNTDNQILNTISSRDNGYLAKFYIDEVNYPSVSEVKIESAFDDNYYLFKQTGDDSGLRTRRYTDWSLINYTDAPLQTDENGTFIEIPFNTEMELKFGKLVKLQSNSKEYLFRLRLSEKEIVEKTTLTATDEETGNTINVSAPSTYLPEGSQLVLIINPDEFERDYDADIYDQNKSVWYQCVVKYHDEIIKVDGADVSIELSDDYIDSYKQVTGSRNETESGIATIYWNSTKTSTPKFNCSGNTFRATNISLNNYAFAFLKVIAREDIEELSDGIYSAKAYLNHESSLGRYSMANSALIHDVYIVRDGGVNRLYFKACEMTVEEVKCYLAEIFATELNTGIPIDGSINYTSFVEDDGSSGYYATGGLRDNAGYNSITQFACVTGGILIFDNNSYDSDKHSYYLGVTSAVMDALAKTPYEQIIANNTSGDGLHVWLSFTDVEKCDDSVTLDTILNEYGYGYQPSALLRKIKQTEAKYNIGKNTASDSTAFADAYAVYNKADATSQEIEAAINALDEVTTDTIPTATATVKGYSLTAKEDFGLHLFVDLGYDAQNDENAAVKFTISDKEQTIAVSDATFVEGKGYEFTLDVPAKKMYDEITAEIVLSEGAEIIGDADLGTYSVAGYLNDYITSDDDTLDALAQATLTYGAYADKFFNGSTDVELTDVSGVTADTVAEYSCDIDLTNEGIEFVGASLTLESKTSVNFYFKVDEEKLYDITDFTFTVNGQAADTTANGDYYYITVNDLTAGQLGTAQTFTVNDTEYSYSPFSYVNAVLSHTDETENADLHNLVKALYLYGVEACKVA